MFKTSVSLFKFKIHDFDVLLRSTEDYTRPGTDDRGILFFYLSKRPIFYFHLFTTHFSRYFSTSYIDFHIHLHGPLVKGVSMKRTERFYTFLFMEIRPTVQESTVATVSVLETPSWKRELYRFGPKVGIGITPTGEIGITPTGGTDREGDRGTPFLSRIFIGIPSREV